MPQKIMMVWEFGETGKLYRLLNIARALKQNDHEIAFACSNLSMTERLLAPHGFKWFQSPILPVIHTNNTIKNRCSLADILHAVGFNNPDMLICAIKAWINLFQLYKPDTLIFNYSPTALLAAKALDVNKVIVGTGYDMPPTDKYPTPQFKIFDNIFDDQLKLSEDSVIQSINYCSKILEIPQINSLSEFFKVDASIILSFKELDYYWSREDTEYWGTIPTLKNGVEPIWPDVKGKRIFAYLKPFQNLPNFLELLKKANQPTLIYIQNLPAGIKEKYNNSNIKFSPDPVDINQVAEKGDLFICHSGHETVATILLAGKPMLLLPRNVEQFITATNAEKFGCLKTNLNLAPEELADQLNRLIEDNSLVNNAKEFAQKYAAYDPAISLRKIVEIIERLEK